MNESTNQAERVRFGEFELNLRTGELCSIGTAAVGAGSAKVLLREQPFQILRILVERQGNIVTRQEIRQILWRNSGAARIPTDRASRTATEFARRSRLTRTASRRATRTKTTKVLAKSCRPGCVRGRFGRRRLRVLATRSGRHTATIAKDHARRTAV